MTRPVPPGRWAWLYPHCQDCGSATEPHYARGYCLACYHRWHGRERVKRLRAHETRAQARARRDARARYMREWRAARKEKANG